MSKNTLFNYFKKLPGSENDKTNGSSSPSIVTSTTPKRPSKESSATPKRRTPKAVDGSSKKDKNDSSKKENIANSGSTKKTIEKRKTIQQGNVCNNRINVKLLSILILIIIILTIPV